MADIFDDDFPEDESFEIKFSEDHDPNRPGTRIYNGVMELPFLDMYEMLLVICLLVKSNSEVDIDTINTVTISINKLTKMTLMSAKDTKRSIKKLEKKGILIREKDVSLDDVDAENTYRILNYYSVWDSATLEELKENMDKIKREMSLHMS